MNIQPYLIFDGRCDEAIEFYKKAIGAKVKMLMRFKESPDKGPTGSFPPEVADKVMHARLDIGNSVMLLSDGHCKNAAKFEGISMTLSVGKDADAERYFAALSEGGKVNMPLAKTFFSSRFGMLHDRFGVSWMVIVEA